MRLSPRLSLFLTLAWTLVLLGGWALLVEVTSEAAPLAYGPCVGLTVLGHIPVGDDPRGIAVVGDKVYVANHDDGSISVIDSGTLTVTGEITAGTSISNPCSIAYNPNNGYLYVTDRLSSGNGTVAVINPTTGLTVTDPIAVGTKPTGLAVNPDDGCVYVANLGSGTVSVISNTSVITTIATGGEPSHIAINSVRDLVYVTDHNTADSGVIVIDSATRSYSQTIELVGLQQQAPWGIAVDSDTGWVYVATIDGGRLVRIRPTHTVSDAIETPITASLRMAAIDPFLNLVFVTQDDLNTTGSDPYGSHHDPPTAEMEKVLVYDIETENWASDFITMPVQQDPERGIAFDTVRHRLYVSNRRSNTVTVIEETLCKDYMPIIMKSFS